MWWVISIPHWSYLYISTWVTCTWTWFQSHIGLIYTNHTYNIRTIIWNFNPTLVLFILWCMMLKMMNLMISIPHWSYLYLHIQNLRLLLYCISIPHWSYLYVVYCVYWFVYQYISIPHWSYLYSKPNNHTPPGKPGFQSHIGLIYTLCLVFF